MKLASRLQERAAPYVERGQAFLRDFEWTWSRAVVFCLVMWFLALATLAFIPSFWLYYASQKLGWRQCPCPSAFKFWLFEARDVVAVALFSIPFGAFITVPFFLQKMRRRLRSESESRPTGGYR